MQLVAEAQRAWTKAQVLWVEEEAVGGLSPARKRRGLGWSVLDDKHRLLVR